MASLRNTSSVFLFTSILLLSVCPFSLASPPSSQETASALREQNAFCNFESGKQVSVRYNTTQAGRSDGPPLNKIWMPGGVAMTLFTETPLQVAGTEVPTGAYTLYLLPGKKDWKFIVSHNSAVDHPYDEKQDLVRAPMDIGTLSNPETELNVTFGRPGRKQCELDVDFGKTKAWITLNEK
jgi:hypothetical protein